MSETISGTVEQWKDGKNVDVTSRDTSIATGIPLSSAQKSVTPKVDTLPAKPAANNSPISTAGGSSKSGR